MTTEQRVLVTPLGEQALTRFMSARNRECPYCEAAPGFPCVVTERLKVSESGQVGVNKNLNKPRAHFHIQRYADAKR